MVDGNNRSDLFLAGSRHRRRPDRKSPVRSTADAALNPLMRAAVWYRTSPRLRTLVPIATHMWLDRSQGRGRTSVKTLVIIPESSQPASDST